MLVQLKMYVARKNFGKICLKAICPKEIPFFQYAVCDQRRGEGTQFFGGGCIQQKSPTLIPSLSGKFWSPHKDNPEDDARSAYSNDFGNSEWEYFL